MTPAASSSSAAGGPVWARDFVLLSAIWGASFMFMDLAAVEFGAVPTAAVRVSIAALFLLPLLLKRGLGPQLLQHWKPVFLVGLLNSGIPFALYCFALLTISTGLSAILNATAPLFGAAVAWLWLKDRLSASRTLGLLIGLSGVALLVWNKADGGPNPAGASSRANLLAIGACLLACLCYGTAASFTKRYLTGLPPLLTAAGSQLGAALGLALPALWLWPAHMPGARSWLSLLALGVLCTGLAYILFFRLIEHAGPARALAVTFVVPVFAVLYGVAFLDEHVTLWMALCAAVIVCGTALSTGLLKLGRRNRLPASH
ncbi:DMT family transporter [Polaromonas sp. C04]|uniref:DMT family transporter n=1 Tax=Polaromonas sp. C04 TaxID=1945857 RepID=UPI0009C76527|nr:DMT family transporter [Polaromonas sp. C04]OOG60613.1 EamA family transporter [Polaromonas sp. C04]